MSERERERAQPVPHAILYAKSCSRAYVNGIEIRLKRCNTVAGEYYERREKERVRNTQWEIEREKEIV